MKEGCKIMLEKMNKGYKNQEKMWRKEIEKMKREYRGQMVKQEEEREIIC